MLKRPRKEEDGTTTPTLKLIVLDVLKPREPHLPEFAFELSTIKGIKRVDITLIEIDEQTESIKVLIEGSAIDHKSVKEHMIAIGAVIHSVDQVVVEG